MQIDLHGYHLAEIVFTGSLAKIVQQAWEMGEPMLILIHGHGRNRGMSACLVNTNTGYFGLCIREALRHDLSFRQWIKHTTLDCSDMGSISIKLKATQIRPENNLIACKRNVLCPTNISKKRYAGLSRANVRINFVNDPIIREQRREQHTYQPQPPAPPLPTLPKRRTLHRNVHNIRRAIANIREQRQRAQWQQGLQGHSRTKVRPCGDDPHRADGGEYQVIDQPARLPIADRIDH